MFHQGTKSRTPTNAIRLRLALVALALLIGGLVSAQTATAQDAEPTCNPSGDDNDRLYCVWLAEPRFGGMSVDQSNASVLRVLLTGDDPTDPAADRVLGEVNRLWDRDFTGTTVATADYTVGQLNGWFDTLAAHFHELMTGVDLDEAGNRITVMVADLDEDEGTVEEHVAGLGVPAAAVQFKEFQLLPPDPVPAAQSSGGSAVAGQSLTGKLDLLVGGGETRSLGTCSMGFAVGFVNTQGKYEEGFVTAGHCNNGSTGDEYHINATNFRDVYGVSIWNALPNGVDAQYVRKNLSTISEIG